MNMKKAYTLSSFHHETWKKWLEKTFKLLNASSAINDDVDDMGYKVAGHPMHIGVTVNLYTHTFTGQAWTS